MKRCITAHNVPTFGDIPVGSLWAEDSPFIEDAANFEDVEATEVPEHYAPKPARKARLKKINEVE